MQRQTSNVGSSNAKTIISNGSNAPIYRKNSSLGLATSNGSNTLGNKYSGNYGPKRRTPSRSRGTSLDRRERECFD